MPQIPVYTQRTTPQGRAAIPQAPSVAGETFYLANSIARAGDAWSRKLEADASAWAGAELLRVREEWDKQFTDRQLSADDGAPDFTKSLLDDFEASRQEVLKRAPTETAKAYLTQKLDAYRQELSGASLQFEAQAGVNHRTRLNEQANDAARKIARVRPEKFGELLQERLDAIEASALPLETKANLREQATQALAVDSLIGMAKADPEGTLMKLYAEPGKSGVAAIEALTQDGRDNVLRFVQGEMAALVQAEEAAYRRAKQDQDERHDAGNRVATLRALRGELSTSQLADLVASDNIDPDKARTVAGFIKERAGGVAVDDPETLFSVRVNLLDYSEQEIAALPGLKPDTKADLIEKRRAEQDSWRGSVQGREAASRIDRALGIVPGTMMEALTPDEKTRRERALTQWFDAVEALPAGEREARALPLANQIIQDVVRSSAEKEAATLRNRLESYKALAGDPAEMSKAKRAEYDARIKNYEEQIRALEARQ